MTIVMHQWGKDVRRYALWLAAWALACALPLAALVIPADAIMSRVALNTVAPVLRLVVFVVLIGLVVHEDPTVGSTAFWLTRPIGGGALYASKLLFVGTLIVLPVVVVEIALMVSTGVGARLVLLAVPEIVLEWVVRAACVFAIASLTATLPGMLGATLKVALLAIVVYWLTRIGLSVAYGITASSLLQALVFSGAATLNSEFDPWHELPSVLASRALATLSLLVAVALVVAAIQYRTRRPRFTTAMLTLGLVSVLWVRVLWRWDFVGLPPSRSAMHETIPGSARVSLEPIGHVESMAFEHRGGAVDEKVVYGQVFVSGIEPPLAPEVERLDGWLTFADGSRLALGGARVPVAESRWNAAVLEPLLGGARFVNLEQEQAIRTAILRVPVADFERHADVPGHLSGTVSLTLRRYRIVSGLPLRPNASYGDGVEQVVVESVHTTNGDCMISLRETQVALLLAPNPHLHRRMLFMRFNPDVLDVLRNRERRQAFWPMLGMNFGFGWFGQARIDETTMVHQYRSNLATGAPLPRIDDAWLAGADLVRIEAETVGTMSAPVDVPSFTIARQ